MTFEEARADLMLAQADVSYRPKDDSIDMAIIALKNQTSVITELESLLRIMIKRNNQAGHTDGWYMGSATMINIIDRRICELTNEEYKPYLERMIEAELKGE